MRSNSAEETSTSKQLSVVVLSLQQLRGSPPPRPALCHVAWGGLSQQCGRQGAAGKKEKEDRTEHRAQRISHPPWFFTSANSLLYSSRVSRSFWFSVSMSCRRCTLSWSCCPRSRAGTGSVGEDSAHHPHSGHRQATFTVTRRLRAGQPGCPGSRRPPLASLGLPPLTRAQGTPAPHNPPAEPRAPWQAGWRYRPNPQGQTLDVA